MTKPKLLQHLTLSSANGLTFKVGRASFTVPTGVEVRRVSDGLAYTYDRLNDDLHAFIQSGEVTIPPEVVPVILAKYFPGSKPERRSTTTT